MMKLRIVSDGTMYGTSILDSETGEDLTRKLGVTAVSWKCSIVDRGAVSEATITIRNVAVEIREDRACLDQ